MRFPRPVLLLASIGTVSALSLVLSGCTSSITGSSSGRGAAPTVTAVVLQEDPEPNNKQEVQFSEAMDPSTINAQTFTVRDSSGHSVGGVVRYDANYSIASFQPSPALQPVTKYTATIGTGVASAGGVHLTAPYTYTFTTTYNTTGDYNQPFSIKSVSPVADATCISANTTITITFDRAPDANTVNSTNIVVTGPGGVVIPVMISINVTTTQVVLTPASPLPSGTITVTVNNVGDLADKMMTAPYTWSFSTACSGGGGGGNTYVYAGSSTSIAGFQVAADGSTAAVPGSPFALAGVYLSPSPSGNFLYDDFFNGPSGTGLTYYTYSVETDGSLSTASSTTQMANDPATGTPPQSLGWIATDRTGTSLYSEQGFGGTGSGNQWIGEYAVGTNGSLSSLAAVEARGASAISFTSDDRYGFYGTSGPGVIGLESVVRNPDGTLSGNRNWQASLPMGAPPSVGFYAIVSPNTNYVAVNFLQVFGTEIGNCCVSDQQ